jgi:hypothetical protein
MGAFGDGQFQISALLDVTRQLESLLRGAVKRKDLIWLIERSTHPNTVLENRKASRFSVVLTARGGFEDANST